jgi:hypothetical protein
MILTFKKIQVKSENHEIYQYIMISYMEFVEKWVGFAYCFTHDAYKSKRLRRSFIELRKMWLDLQESDFQIGIWIQNIIHSSYTICGTPC